MALSTTEEPQAIELHDGDDEAIGHERAMLHRMIYQKSTLAR